MSSNRVRRIVPELQGACVEHGDTELTISKSPREAIDAIGKSLLSLLCAKLLCA